MYSYINRITPVYVPTISYMYFHSASARVFLFFFVGLLRWTGDIDYYPNSKSEGGGGSFRSERPQMQNAQIPTEYFYTEICP